MTQHEEMHALVVCYCYRWIDLLFQTWMRIDFESICHSIGALVSDEALFENKWCILLHILNPSVLLTLFINDNVKFFNWLLILSI